MYNSELKERFLKESPEFKRSAGRIREARRFFTKAEPYEIERDSDLCTMSKEEVMKIINECVGVRVSSQVLVISVAESYFLWCINNEVDDANEELLKLDDPVLDKLRLGSVKSPEHLKRYLDSIFINESYQTTDLVPRCFLWLGYAGLDVENVYDIKCEDVDLEKKVFYHNSIEYPIYDEALNTFKLCVELPYLYKAYGEGFSKQFRVNDNVLLRTSNMDHSINTIRVRLTKAARQQKYITGVYPNDDVKELTISYIRANISGIFYRTYLEEKETGGFSFRRIAEQKANTNREDKDSQTQYLSTIRVNDRRYKIDYQRWKEAWELK